VSLPPTRRKTSRLNFCLFFLFPPTHPTPPPRPGTAAGLSVSSHVQTIKSQRRETVGIQRPKEIRAGGPRRPHEWPSWGQNSSAGESTVFGFSAGGRQWPVHRGRRRRNRRKWRAHLLDIPGGWLGWFIQSTQSGPSAIPKPKGWKAARAWHLSCPSCLGCPKGPAHGGGSLQGPAATCPAPLLVSPYYLRYTAEADLLLWPVLE
jgi:hypothetical protein